MKRRSIAAIVENRRGGYRGWEDDVKFRKPNYRLIAIIFVGAVIVCSACGFLPLFLVTANNSNVAQASSLTLVASATQPVESPTPSATLDDWSATGTAIYYATYTPTYTPTETPTLTPSATPEMSATPDMFASITAAWMTITAHAPIVITQVPRVEQIVVTQPAQQIVVTQPPRVERVVITQPAQQIVVTQPPIVIISTTVVIQPPIVVTATHTPTLTPEPPTPTLELPTLTPEPPTAEPPTAEPLVEGTP